MVFFSFITDAHINHPLLLFLIFKGPQKDEYITLKSKQEKWKDKKKIFSNQRSSKNFSHSISYMDKSELELEWLD